MATFAQPADSEHNCSRSVPERLLVQVPPRPGHHSVVRLGSLEPRLLERLPEDCQVRGAQVWGQWHGEHHGQPVHLAAEYPEREDLRVPVGLVPADGPDVRHKLALPAGDDPQQLSARADDPQPAAVHDQAARAACPAGPDHR